MEAFKFDGAVAHLFRDGTSSVAASTHGPPVRIDGYNIGVVPVLDGPSPHRGEVHPDGDELLYVVSGCIDVVLGRWRDADDVGIEEHHRVGPGEAFLVPRGVWHTVLVVEPAHLVHVTPGPGSGHRPLEETTSRRSGRA